MYQQYNIPSVKNLRAQQVRVTESFISDAVETITDHILMNAEHKIIAADQEVMMSGNLTPKITASLFTFEVNEFYPKNFKCACDGEPDAISCFLTRDGKDTCFLMRDIIINDSNKQIVTVPAIKKVKDELSKLGYKVGYTFHTNAYEIMRCTIFVEWDNPAYTEKK